MEPRAGSAMPAVQGAGAEALGKRLPKMALFPQHLVRRAPLRIGISMSRGPCLDLLVEAGARTRYMAHDGLVNDTKVSSGETLVSFEKFGKFLPRGACGL